MKPRRMRRYCGKRGRVLRALLAVTLVEALVAVGLLLYANDKRTQADARAKTRSPHNSHRTHSRSWSAVSPEHRRSDHTGASSQEVSKSPDRGALLTTLNRTARLVSVSDAPNGRFLSANGTRVASQTDAGVQLLDTATGAAVGPPFGHPGDTPYARSPDGRYLALVNKTRSSCGIPRPDNPLASQSLPQSPVIPWPSVPTGTGWPPTTPKATCGCGRSWTGSRSANRSHCPRQHRRWCSARTVTALPQIRPPTVASGCGTPPPAPRLVNR